ncbi:hypothetical protein TOK_1744 [Pseudonocardia sp. N23]|nr:hypothetical protein TOK_1744 [Pseudonocardia sp. N23]
MPPLRDTGPPGDAHQSSRSTSSLGRVAAVVSAVRRLRTAIVVVPAAAARATPPRTISRVSGA